MSGVGGAAREAAPVLPSLRRMISFAYLMPLPLYGSGGRSARILAAVRPSRCLSTARTVSLVCLASTSAVTPSGSLKTTGCEKPSAKWMSLPFTSALKPTPVISRPRS